MGIRHAASSTQPHERDHQEQTLDLTSTPVSFEEGEALLECLTEKPRDELTREALEAIPELVEHGYLTESQAELLLRQIVARSARADILEMLDEVFLPSYGTSRRRRSAGLLGGLLFPS